MKINLNRHCSVSTMLNTCPVYKQPHNKTNIGKFHTSKMNLIELKNKININKNQIKLFNATQIMLSFLNSVSGLDNKTILILTKLISILEKEYRKDPNGFCNLSKDLSNWFKVNIMKKIRTRDKIKEDDWDNTLSCPILLSEIMLIVDLSERSNEVIMLFRVCLTILDFYQVINVKNEPKLETITGDYSGKPDYWDQINIERSVKMLGIKRDKFIKQFYLENNKNEFHTSSSSGPNGQALWMSHIDAKAVYNDKELSNNMREFSKIVGREDLFEKMEDCIRIPQFFKMNSGTPLHSKLHFIFEKGNKVRTIAIMDYFTQEFLCPLHNVLADVLRNIYNDGTFDQDKISKIVKNYTAQKDQNLYSFDLTAATDRLPVKLQSKILTYLTGIDGFGLLWSNLIVERDFNLPDRKEKIRYKVGQPMGVKSSFPMLGLTHHIIVMEAAARSGLSTFKDYVILGDDIMIANKDVANRYKDIMRDLGLELSEHKSIISLNQLTKGSIAEICKRIYLDGQEITPFPIKLAVKVLEMKDLAYQLQEVMFKRDFIKNDQNFKLFIINLIKDDKLASKQLALLNCLPEWATGMKSRVQLTTRSEYILSQWKEFRGFTIEQFKQVFIFTVLVEQLKRLNAILTNTESVYATIVKAASVSKTEGIGVSMEQYLPVETFSQEIAEEWDIVEVFHPAIEAVKNECERINDIILQISVINDEKLMDLLLSSVIDSLKISSFEIIELRDYAEAKLTRKLLETTFKNISKLISESRNSDTLNFSTKLKRLNIIWNISVSLDRNVTLNRASGQILTDRDKMLASFNDFEKEL